MTSPPSLPWPDHLLTLEEWEALPQDVSRRFELVWSLEVVSPGSARVDRIVKLADYAEAGIPNYWIIGIDGPVTLDAFTLVGGGYARSVGAAGGLVELAQPAPLTIDPVALA